MNSEQSEILKSDTLGRVRTSRRRREAILDDFERSGMSGAAYARQHGINYQTFANWIQKRRRSRGDYDKAAQPAGVPMELALAEVVVQASATEGNQSANEALLRIELPGGANLILNEGSQVPLAAALIRHLGADNQSGSK
jgi:transposase-like protein